MALYVALCYYDRDHHWDSVPDPEFTPEYTEFARRARPMGDLAVAEDALSEATITALDAWPRTGIPDNPRAWLAVVARRKALDLLRRESARAAKETAAFRWGTGAAPDQIEEAIE